MTTVVKLGRSGLRGPAGTNGSNYVPCDVVVVGSYWRMTPKSGFAVVNTGLDQVFFGKAPAASPASLGVRVVGINSSEERVVKRSDGSKTVTTGDILIDGFFAIYYHGSGTRAGLFQLIDGLASSGSASGGGLLTKMAQTTRVNNTVDLAADTGYALPNNTGDDTIMVWEVEADGLPESAWIFNVAGINAPDGYAVQYRDGTVLSPTTLKAGDRLFFSRPGGTGAYFTILQHWKADTALGGGGSGLSFYERAAARGAAERAATAERLARRALARPVGYETGVGGTVTQATSKSTGVTLNKAAGRITLNAASLAAGAAVAFTLTNSEIAADDIVLVTIKSGATAAGYDVQVEATAAGSCSISIRNRSGGALAEAVVLNFAVIKSVAA